MELSSLLFNHSYPDDPKRGSLLIAEPFMKGDVFSRSVILILDVEQDQGHLGLELNKCLSVDLSDLIENLETERKIPVFRGGPVDSSRLFMLHTLGEEFRDSSEILPGLFVGGSLEDVYEYLSEGGETEGKIRFFLGYSGWTKGQLRSEIDHQVWALNNEGFVDANLLLTGKGNSYWRREVERLGSGYRSWLIVPRDPKLN